MANPQKEKDKIDGGATIWARQTIDSEIFSNKPDKWFKIWFYLINQVNHKDTKQFKRGSGFTRYEWIMEKTKATRNEIDHCIRWLKSATMIATQKATRGFIITIHNYERFQALSNYESDTKATQKATASAKQKRNKSDTINKNDKNVNKEPPIPPLKRGNGEFIVSKMQVKPEKQKTETAIQQLVNFYKTEIEEIPLEDKSWDKKFYPKYVKFAKEILDFCQGNEKQSERVIYEIAEYLEGKKLDYNLATIARWRWRWKKGFKEEGE